MLTLYRSTKVFSLESFPLYGVRMIIHPRSKAKRAWIRRKNLHVTCIPERRGNDCSYFRCEMVASFPWNFLNCQARIDITDHQAKATCSYSLQPRRECQQTCWAFVHLKVYLYEVISFLWRIMVVFPFWFFDLAQEYTQSILCGDVQLVYFHCVWCHCCLGDISVG